jgi:hypothetical protein
MCWKMDFESDYILVYLKLFLMRLFFMKKQFCKSNHEPNANISLLLEFIIFEIQSCMKVVRSL